MNRAKNSLKLFFIIKRIQTKWSMQEKRLKNLFKLDLSLKKNNNTKNINDKQQKIYENTKQF